MAKRIRERKTETTFLPTSVPFSRRGNMHNWKAQFVDQRICYPISKALLGMPKQTSHHSMVHIQEKRDQGFFYFYFLKKKRQKIARLKEYLVYPPIREGV